MATKRVPRARISVSTPELAIIFRGDSVSGHPWARGGTKKSENRPENSPNKSKKYSIARGGPASTSNFRAQVVIDVANFAKTENGHETGPQGTDFSLDP